MFLAVSFLPSFTKASAKSLQVLPKSMNVEVVDSLLVQLVTNSVVSSASGLGLSGISVDWGWSHGSDSSGGWLVFLGEGFELGGLGG